MKELNAISFSGESCSHSIINYETSPINFLPAFPDGNSRFFSKTRQFHKLVISSFQTHDLCTFPRCISRSVLKVHLSKLKFLWRIESLLSFQYFHDPQVCCFLIDKIVDVALDHGLSGSFEHNCNIYETISSYFRLHLTCLTTSI